MANCLNLFCPASVVVAQEQEEKVSKNSLYKQTDDEPDIGEADQENWKESRNNLCWNGFTKITFIYLPL